MKFSKVIFGLILVLTVVSSLPQTSPRQSRRRRLGAHRRPGGSGRPGRPSSSGTQNGRGQALQSVGLSITADEIKLLKDKDTINLHMECIINNNTQPPCDAKINRRVVQAVKVVFLEKCRRCNDADSNKARRLIRVLQEKYPAEFNRVVNHVKVTF